jgi:hypothetical protein
VQEIREAIQQVARLRGQPKLSQVAAEYDDRKDSSIGILVFGPLDFGFWSWLILQLATNTKDKHKAQAQNRKGKDQRPKTKVQCLFDIEFWTKDIGPLNFGHNLQSTIVNLQC